MMVAMTLVIAMMMVMTLINDCDYGGDDPLFIMVMTMVMGMITMMMVGMTLAIWVVTICDGGSDDDCN